MKNFDEILNNLKNSLKGIDDLKTLNEIKIMLSAYYHELKKTDSISKSLQIQEHIDALEEEEKQILERCDVII